MGFDIIWHKVGDCEPLPEEFEYRYSLGFDFLSVLWTVRTDSIRDCKCLGKHSYMCTSDDFLRPKDFAEFRNKLQECKLLVEPFIEMVSYLERNPNMYLGFSN